MTEHPNDEDYRNRAERAEQECEELRIERDRWEEDARRYAANAEYWKSLANLDADSEIARLRAFAQGIQDDWIENESDEDDEWSDGYEDCLANYAAKARAALEFFSGSKLDEERTDRSA